MLEVRNESGVWSHGVGRNGKPELRGRESRVTVSDLCESETGSTNTTHEKESSLPALPEHESMFSGALNILFLGISV